MEIGCHLPTTQAPETMGDALVTFAREAERLNVASLWVSDHVIIREGEHRLRARRELSASPERPYLEAVTALAAAAVCTRRARLGSSVFILGHRHPVLMAKMLASIDAPVERPAHLRRRRRAGGEELEILGTPFNARGRQGDEACARSRRCGRRDSPRSRASARSATSASRRSRCRSRIRRSGSAERARARVPSRRHPGRRLARVSRSVAQLREGLAQLARPRRTGRAWETIEISLRFGLSDELVAQGKQAVVDQLCEYKRPGVRHTLVEFRRLDLGRMMDLLGLVAETVRPAVDAA